MSNESRYRLPDPVKAELMRWWHTLSSPHPSGSARADRAVLRRAASLDEVACSPAYQRLYRTLAAAHTGDGWRPYEQERLAALVGLAAHVKTSSTRSLPQAMSDKADGSDRNPVSELRFARLLDSPDTEALYTGLRRCLPLMQHQVSVPSLADDVFGWGDFVKKQWAYAYAWPRKD
ncbi:MAG: type I-E CRISPR-associated protein Cse2/CasB [Burkholderiales bacterium]